MSRLRGNWIICAAALWGFCGHAFASTTATITVNGSEQSGDTNTITIAFNGFAETVHYGQASTAASIASALAGTFSRDYLQAGLCASVTTTGGSTILFKLRGGAPFGQLDVTGSTTSFSLTSSGFASQSSSTLYDAGSVTLTVANSGGTVYSKTTSYGEGATTTSVAEGLAGSDGSVNVTATNDTLYIDATGTGASTDYSYTMASTWNSAFTNPSFQGSPSGGSLQGGDNSGGSQQTVYSYSITNGGGGSGYDPVGNVLNYTDSVTGTWSMTTSGGGSGYDTLNRLIAASPTAGPYQGLTVAWSYDPFGNRTSENFSGTASGSVGIPASTGYTFNANNQIQTSQGSSPPSYDASGDVTCDNYNSGSGKCQGGNQYLYDAEGQVCAAFNILTGQMTGYVYDAEGNRVAKGNITSWNCDPTANGFTAAGNEKDYILGPGGEQVTEVTQDADGSIWWQRTYVYAGGALFATYDPVADTPNQPLPSFRFTDWLGTLRASTDAYGALQSICDGLPYGNGEGCGGNTPDPRYFSNKERDQETFNDYFGARYYESLNGRFLTPDWSAKVEPVPYAKLDNPQSLNLYAYVGNNPLTGVDSDGHFGCNEAPQFCGSISGAAEAGTNEPGDAKYVAVNSGGDGAQQQTDNKPVGSTTVGSLEKTMTHEDGSLSTPKGGDPTELEKGKTALANAIINGAEAPHPPLVATPTVPASGQDAQIMRDAYTNRANGGADPVNGRTFYGTSHTPPDRLHSRPIGNGRQSVYAHFGPFHDSIGRGRDTYIYIYNAPGH